MAMVSSRSLYTGINVTNCKIAIKQSIVGALFGDDCVQIRQGLSLVTTVQQWSLDWLCRWYVVYLNWCIICCQVMTDQLNTLDVWAWVSNHYQIW